MLEEIENFVTDYPKKKLGEQVKGMTLSNTSEDKQAKTMSVEDIFFSKLESMGINLEELKAVLLTKGNTLINSCAGSGKTTALVLKIIFDLLTGDTMKTVYMNDTVNVKGEVDRGKAYKVPKKILVSTFLKTGAEEIKKAFNDWCRKLGLKGISADILTVKTMHAEFYDVIKGIYGNVNLVSDTQKYVREIMLEKKIRSKTAYSRTLTIDEVKDMECILTYARNRLDNSKYKHPLLADYGLFQQSLDLILQEFQIKKQVAGGELDYEDLQELLYQGVQQNDKLRQYLASRYEVIYLDEFQDTAQLQYGLLKCYFDGADKVVVVGDEDQCIYSWRGSDVNIITEQFEKDYKPNVLALTTNYRCSANILNPITTSIVLNSNRHEKELKAYRSGGTVNIVYSKNPSKLINSIYEDLKEGRSIGVISRTNYDLLIPAIILELDGTIKFSTSKQVTLDNRMAKQIFGIIDLVNKRYTPEFPNFLSLFLSRYSQYEADVLCQMLSANPMMSIYTIPDEDLKYSLPTLYPFLKVLRDTKKNEGDLATYKYILTVLRDRVFASDSQYAMRARDLIGFIINLLNESDILKGKDISEVDRILNEVLPKRLKNRTTYTGAVDIKLTTVHEAKGKEWDSVYIWNDIDGVFPASVGKRKPTLEEYEEERRIHYIAWTRPREKLTVFTSVGMESPFLKECTLGEGCKTDKGNMISPKKEGAVLQLNKKVVEKQGTNEDITAFLERYVQSRNMGDSEIADKTRKVLMKMPVQKLIEKLVETVELLKKEGIIKQEGDESLNYIQVDYAMMFIASELGIG